MRPFRDPFDIAIQPDAQTAGEAQNGKFWSLHQQVSQVVEQAKVIHVSNRGNQLSKTKVFAYKSLLPYHTRSNPPRNTVGAIPGDCPVPEIPPSQGNHTCSIGYV